MALVVLVMQILTGIFLAMHYKPDIAMAFDSIERLMREVEWGWLIRYAHSTGASFFFVVVYLHMFRAHAVRLLQGASRAVMDYWHVDSISRSWRKLSWATCCRGATCPTGARRSS